MDGRGTRSDCWPWGAVKQHVAQEQALGLRAGVTFQVQSSLVKAIEPRGLCRTLWQGLFCLLLLKVLAGIHRTLWVGALGALDKCVATICHKVRHCGGWRYVQKHMVSAGCCGVDGWPCVYMLLSIWLCLEVNRYSQQGNPGCLEVYCLAADRAKV